LFVPRFDAVDATDPVGCAAFLDLAQSLEDVQSLKRLGYDMLNVESGDSVLDIGCGTGADVVALAARVGDRGWVTGVDLSVSLIARARARADSVRLPVAFCCVDMHKMPFPDGSFTRTRIDRVLHFLPDPRRAIAEAVRVTAYGGRMLVTEPDWSTLTIFGGDDRLQTLIWEGNGPAISARWTGSELPELLGEAGLDVRQSHRSTLELRDYRVAAALFGFEALAGRAVASGHLSASEAVRWLRSLQRAAARAELVCALSGQMVCAVKGSEGEDEGRYSSHHQVDTDQR
jgi:SAM-dependent methyltransferase